MSSSYNALKVFCFFLFLSIVIFICPSYFEYLFSSQVSVWLKSFMCSHLPVCSLAYFLFLCNYFCFCTFLQLLGFFAIEAKVPPIVHFSFMQRLCAVSTDAGGIFHIKLVFFFIL